MGAMKELMSGEAGEAAEKEMNRIGGIIDSMTPAEKRNPKVIDTSRRRRIAAGAGAEPHQVNDLIKQFEPMADLMKNMGQMGLRGRMQAMQQMTQLMGQNPQAGLKKQKKGTGKRLTPKERAKMQKEKARAQRKNKRKKK